MNPVNAISLLFSVINVCLLAMSADIFSRQDYDENSNIYSFAFICTCGTGLILLTTIYANKTKSRETSAKCFTLVILLYLVLGVYSAFGIPIVSDNSYPYLLRYLGTAYIGYFFSVGGLLIISLIVLMVHLSCQARRERQSLRSSGSVRTSLRKYMVGINVEEACPICWEEYNTSEKLMVLGCGHYAHETCLKSWYEKSRSCPICRSTTPLLP